MSEQRETSVKDNLELAMREVGFYIETFNNYPQKSLEVVEALKKLIEARMWMTYEFGKLAQQEQAESKKTDFITETDESND